MAEMGDDFNNEEYGPVKKKRNISFECSYPLDSNSIRALEHDDDEDQVHRNAVAAASAYNRQKQKVSEKKFVVGDICVVCGDVASGIHYSVVACNGCKTFFRRVLIENRVYSCKKNGSCVIDKNCRCGCRHCRFRKCLEVGMDSAELNVERRRKRKVVDGPQQSTAIESLEDPLIRNLMTKEQQFVKMLTSTLAPIHASISEALSEDGSTFNSFDRYEKAQFGADDQMNFSYWRSKILSTCIEWAKSFSEFQQLARADKEALIVHTSFSNLVLSEAFHTPIRFTDRIVFPDGLSGFRNLTANILKEWSGLTPTVVNVINLILVPIRKMAMTDIEYCLLQAIILFDPECLSLTDGAVDVIQRKRFELLHSLRQHTDAQYDDGAHRFASLLLRIPNVQKVAAFKRETLMTIEAFSLMCPHPLTREISKKYPDVSFF